ncbi:5,10-methylenetetrahydrofolate reductase [Acidaminobacter sp. JC074]|uniref:methylenetetrahydrofolate reductase n=1 Tax=Acidaminobacter sp. JC074 TaxID=2530199 RepID=UPI001F1066E0|nr:5,10-methylenetetrahydrofolate reductase [Acidaminobacter sp. JC074]
MLEKKIRDKESGILLYGLTPPKKKTEHEKVCRIAEKQMTAVESIGVDGLVLYDIHDEKDRIDEERPFPFLETIDPVVYSKDYMHDLNVPRIVYRCVGKYSSDDLCDWLQDPNRFDHYSVFVGAASSKQEVPLKLGDAYDLYKACNKNLSLGGVCIPERHITKENEHLRMIKKQENGCQYFISQAVYNVEAAKNFLSDYYFYCKETDTEMVPIIFTISPCGSKKTLDFMKWLGINVSKWLENDILNSRDPLEKSVEICIENFEALWQYAKKREIPIGCNVESISIKKSEIEASVEMAKAIKKIMA